MTATIADLWAELGLSIDHIIEANTALRKRRALAKPERTLTAAMAKAFTAEGRAFLSRLVWLKPRFAPTVQEAANEAEWAPLYDDAATETADLFIAPIDAAASPALEAGITAAVLDLSIETAFDLAHPEAVAYLRDHGATQVARIRETTREGLRVILTQAADEGWSYDRAAKAIRERYKQFSRERARNIAVFELGDAYEAGNRLVAEDLTAGGLDMQKAWLSAKDARVRPEHQRNDAAGWIDLDATFPSGDDRPPTDPRCRCAALYRRKPDA